MKIYDESEAAEKFCELLEFAARGEDVLISRDSTALVRLVPFVENVDPSALNQNGEKADIAKVMDGGEIMKWQGLVRDVILAPHVQDYLVRLTLATHPEGPHSVDATNNYVRWGASPRGAQTLALASKVRALLDGRYNVSFEDIRRVYLPATRHRVLLNFEAQAEGIDPDQVLLEILEKVPEKAP